MEFKFGFLNVPLVVLIIYGSTLYHRVLFTQSFISESSNRKAYAVYVFFIDNLYINAYSMLLVDQMFTQDGIMI